MQNKQADAERKLRELRAQGDGAPVTREDLAKWVSDNIDEIRTRMREAPARRVAMNRRLWPRDDMCAPAPRLQPVSASARISTAWGKILACIITSPHVSLRRRADWLAYLGRHTSSNPAAAATSTYWPCLLLASTPSQSFVHRGHARVPRSLRLV